MDPEEVNYIVFAEQGLVKYRFVMDGDEVHEFDDLEQAIRFAQENDVAHVGVVFPDGDVHLIPSWPGGSCRDTKTRPRGRRHEAVRLLHPRGGADPRRPR